MDNTDKMKAAGLTDADIANCRKRYKESGFKSYEAWCVAYTMLHSELELGVRREGITIDLVPKKPKSIFKVSKNRYKA